MKGDFTRLTFTPEKHFSGVRQQQGRVQLDADWNEQVDIGQHRDQTTAGDVVGECGAPLHNAGFAISSAGGDLQIGAGHYYVDGILCENEAPTSFTTQPDLHGVPLPTQAGTYLAYLDVWQRHLTVIEAPEVREVALGGPDTATRTKTVWQVKLEPVPTSATCQQFGGTWAPANTESAGRLAAQAQPPQADTNKCLVPPGAGFRGLESQLYRVEVHAAGGLGAAKFKWSRDNGSVATAVGAIDGTVLTVESTGRDAVLRFNKEDWVEITDDWLELSGQAGEVRKVADVDDATRKITLAGAPLSAGTFPTSGPDHLTDPARHTRLRLWDQRGAVRDGDGNVIGDVDAGGGVITVPATDATWVGLEDGVQVRFSAEPANGSFRVGDYWLIPARSLTGEIEWPTDAGDPRLLPRHGTEHHYCPLALLNLTGTAWSVLSDCREQFAPLTELNPLSYVSGDGQEAMPDAAQPAALVPLARPLQVGVNNRPGAMVRFQITQGGGRLQAAGGSVDLTTGADGVASCSWELDPIMQSQQVAARLLDDAGHPVGLPVRFNANLSRASAVAYNPGKCPGLAAAKVRTVQEAIDQLCQGEPEPGIPIDSVRTQSPAALLHNDTPLPLNVFLGGLAVTCQPQSQLDPASIGAATVFVTLELPVSMESSTSALWGGPVIGFQPLIVAAEVAGKEKVITWNPPKPTQDWLARTLTALFGKLEDKRILTRLTLKGNFIWDQAQPDVYLDGEAFGVRQPGTQNTDLRMPSGDGRRGGDFEMWFWLVGASVGKPTDVKVTDVKTTDVKASEGKTTEVKVSDLRIPRFVGRPAGPTERRRRGRSPKGRAFITPEERPEPGPTAPEEPGKEKTRARRRRKPSG